MDGILSLISLVTDSLTAGIVVTVTTGWLPVGTGAFMDGILSLISLVTDLLTADIVVTV